MILASYLGDDFDLVKSEKQQQELHLYFEEQNTSPKEKIQQILVFKGFHKEITTIQDFSLRGNTVYLHIKRRRWVDKQSKEIIQKRLKISSTRHSNDIRVYLFLKETKDNDCSTIGYFYDETIKNFNDNTNII